LGHVANFFGRNNAPLFGSANALLSGSVSFRVDFHFRLHRNKRGRHPCIPPTCYSKLISVQGAPAKVSGRFASGSGPDMTTDVIGGYSRENEMARLELGQFLASLRDSDFDREVGGGCKVATVLCHLAFWDQRVLYLLREWQRSPFEAFRLPAQAVNSINEAVRIISRAVPGRLAAQIALESASAVDAEVDRLSEALINQIRGAGFERTLRRSLHRHEHLRKVKEALAANATAPE